MSNPYLISDIESLVKKQLRRPLVTDEAISLWLQIWWSKKYERPLKDPLLLEYTLEELIYEFFISQEYEVVQKEKAELEAEQKEKEKMDQANAWADELEAQMEAQMAQTAPPLTDPEESSEPEVSQEEWMASEEADGLYGQDLELKY